MEPAVGIPVTLGVVHELRHPNNVLSMLIAVILATGVFQLEHTKCHALPARQHSIINTWDWWVKKVLLRLKC